MGNKNRVTVIGPAIIDVLATPFSADVFSKGTHPLDEIKLSFGGNALNEAVVLGRFGVDTELVTKLGDDEAGERIEAFAKKAGVDTAHFVKEHGLSTGVNVVLIDENKERFFLTNPHSSLRKLSLEDIMPFVPDMADIVCFPCVFTSPLLGITEMTELFNEIKKSPKRSLFVDMTTVKNGEIIDDMAGMFPMVDYFMPNEKELSAISGGMDTEEAAKKLIQYGVKNVIVKRGVNDTFVYTADEHFSVPVYKNAKVVDTTGAGDCFGAGLIYGIANGKSLYDSVRFANAVASCAIEKVGATDGVVSIDEPMRRV